MLEANKNLVRRYYELAVRNPAAMGEVVTADFVDHHFPGDIPPGPAGACQFFTKFLPTFFSGLRIEIEYLIAEADRVDCHFIAHFKHTGAALGDIPAKGNVLRVPAISTFRIVNNKLAEAWEIYDSGDMQRQMRA